MVAAIVLALLAAAGDAAGLTAGPPQAPATTNQAQEVIADIQVRGNVATSDDEVRRLAGIAIGDPVGSGTVAEVTARLRGTRRFERVDVLKRFASIADATQIVLVIIVDEGPIDVERTGDPKQPIRVARRREGLMFLPILRYEDGYGFVYGARLARPNPVGSDSRLTFPLTWGGEKRAAAELERDFDRRRTSVSGGISIDRRTHPYFEQDEDRARVWTRVEREIAPSLHAGATGGWQHVSFLGGDDHFVHAGADVTFDNRLDPMLARNAVYARASFERDTFGAHDPVDRWELEGRGYLGLAGQSVLVLRAVREDASRPLPVYLQPVLGGIPTVRGFKLGTAIGDTLAAGSAELRVPLNSPLTIAKIGVSAFVDTGTVYGSGQRFSDQSLKTGVGGSAWVSVAFVRLNVIVAHGIGSSTRLHFGGAVSF